MNVPKTHCGVVGFDCISHTQSWSGAHVTMHCVLGGELRCIPNHNKAFWTQFEEHIGRQILHKHFKKIKILKISHRVFKAALNNFLPFEITEKQ